MPALYAICLLHVNCLLSEVGGERWPGSMGQGPTTLTSAASLTLTATSPAHQSPSGHVTRTAISRAAGIPRGSAATDLSVEGFICGLSFFSSFIWFWFWFWGALWQIYTVKQNKVHLAHHPAGSSQRLGCWAVSASYLCHSPGSNKKRSLGFSDLERTASILGLPVT